MHTFVWTLIATIPPSSERFVLHALMQLSVVIGAAWLGGAVACRIGQPRVVGEILAGLLLGPSLFGQLAPQTFADLFPRVESPVLQVLGHLGLVLFMFTVGMEFDFTHLRRFPTAAAGIAVAGIALPFVLGLAVAAWMHAYVAPQTNRTAFILFLAAALSITALPILGRLMREFRLTTTRVGTLTITAAAVDDALGWMLLAGVSALVAGAFHVGMVLRTLALAAAVVAFIYGVGRWLLAPWLQRDELGTGRSAVVFLAVLISAMMTSAIGLFSVFGPFVLGAVLSHQTELRRAVERQFGGFVTVFLLPVFFAYTGLHTDIRLLNHGSLWAFCGLVTATAMVGKIVGCGLAARLGRLSWRESGIVAVLMNTRALMGLVAATIGHQIGVIPETVFSMLVIMALVTTVMTGPILRRLI